MTLRPEYSVWAFSDQLKTDLCECDHVTFEEALRWFKHHTTNVPANIGMTSRVIIVDGGDCIVAEWKHGQGITWPKD
jgi:hypothetical protein